jgi:hypothetical protein
MNIPQSTFGGLRRYAENRIPPGGFLRAVLENNLREAVGRADLANQAALIEIVKVIYNELPAECWGSPEKVEAWLTLKEE